MNYDENIYTADEREKIDALIAMNMLVKTLNNENAYYCRWIYVIPDEVDDEELAYIATAEEQEETFSDACKLFVEIIKSYGKDGFYLGGKVF